MGFPRFDLQFSVVSQSYQWSHLSLSKVKRSKGNFSWPRLVTWPLLGGHLQSAGDMVKAHTEVAAPAIECQPPWAGRSIHVEEYWCSCCYWCALLSDSHASRTLDAVWQSAIWCVAYDHYSLVGLDLYSYIGYELAFTPVDLWVTSLASDVCGQSPAFHARTLNMLSDLEWVKLVLCRGALVSCSGSIQFKGRYIENMHIRQKQWLQQPVESKIQSTIAQSCSCLIRTPSFAPLW